MAEAVSHVYSDTELKVRMGGDEFLVMGTFVSETVLIEKENMIGEYLKGYVEKTNLPMALEVSTGYSFSDLSNVSDSSQLESMLQTADIRMYEKKQLKKKKQKK